MRSPHLEDTMNTLFKRHIPLSAAQNERLARACVGVLLAGSSHVPKIARQLTRPRTQAGRIGFVSRLLQAPFVRQEWVYQPWLRHLLRGMHEPVWHLIMDRSTLRGYEFELLLISLSFRKHAIPLVWQVIDFGCTSAEEQLALWQQVLPLIDPQQPVVAHGDSEFGSVAVMRFLQQQGWHFIVGAAANTRYRLPGTADWRLLADLPVRQRHPVYLQRVAWTQQHGYGPLNVFAFYDPHQNSPESQRRDIRYCATSLPITHTLRRIGRRRWGIEPFFKDFKSAGWQVDLSKLRHFERWESLMTLLSTTYVWIISVGRWLCKIGHRYEIDNKSKRHYSIFRIGWDWLISQFRQGHGWPLVSTLYS